MKRQYWVLAISVVVIALVIGCFNRPTKPATTVQTGVDEGVTVRITEIGFLNRYRVEVSYSGQRDMEWWAHVTAVLYDSEGDEVLRPKRKADPSWFVWKEDTAEDENIAVNHFGNYRRDNPLVETLILDTDGLQPGTYRVEPIVTLYERGSDADPKAKGPIVGLKPGKAIGCKITVQ